MTSVLVDSNIVIDLYQPIQDRFGVWAARMLASVGATAPLVVSPVVAAEVAFRFDRPEDLVRLFPVPVWTREALPFEAAFPAGKAHALYRRRGGLRERTLPDFLIGAHALVRGHRLLTRDASRYRLYFPDLDIIAPETHP